MNERPGVRWRKGQVQTLDIQAGDSFITLKPGPAKCEKFLQDADRSALGWIRRTSLLYRQAQRISRRYLGEDFDVERKVHKAARAEENGVSDVPLLDRIRLAAFRNVVKPLNTTIHRESQSHSQPPTPSAVTPVRTPSLKIKVKPSPASTPAGTPGENVPTPKSSLKKRKRDGPDGETDKPKTAAPLLKLITKNAAAAASKGSAITPGIKLKTRGKIPKRPTGVGYDSELEDREIDPVILESFVLRMPPGDDCEYIRKSIADGTVGVSVLQGGANIRMRFLDVNGRRGILFVKDRQYAFTVVDLPTITEGMKSWDRKNFIKSVDISQLCLVLGPCKNDEEARTYPLPPDVNPKNYQYAHGLTAPMHNVRKRRFERTARARLDDIEAIERKVNSLLEADSKASSTTYEVLDYDPRNEEYSAEEYDSDEDAEGEEEDSYFPVQHPDAEHQETPDYTNEDLSALEAMFEQGVNDEMDVDANAAPTTLNSSLDPNSSAGPSPAAVDTPADAETPASQAVEDAEADDDGADDDNDNDNFDDDDEEDQEANDEKAETLAKIKEAEDKIAQQRAQLAGTSNQIIKKKIAKKIQDLESDIRMMRRHAGIKEPGAEDDEEEGEGGRPGDDGESEEE